MPGPQPRLHLPYSQWPSADRLLWERAICTDDPFADNGVAHLAKATLDNCMRAWRRFLGFFSIHEPTALDIAPPERLTKERVRALAAHLAETCAAQSVASVVEGLYQAAQVMLPECDWNWLKTMKSRLHAAAPAHSPVRPIITSLQLLDLGEQLMGESKPQPDAPFSNRDAVRYRDGLMFGLLAFVPLRPRNLVALEIGRHVVLQGHRWFLVIPREETKTRTPLQFPIPELLEPYLACYLDAVRPRLLRRSTSALWVSGKGGGLSYAAVKHIFRRLSARLGLHIAPNDGRDAAATTWAISAPERIEVASDLLGHAELRTLRHYNRAKGIEASRAYRRVLAGLRKRENRCRLR